MKRMTGTVVIVLGLCALAGSGLEALGSSVPGAGGKGREIVLVGRLVCSYCTLLSPSGRCTKACCTHCLKSGDTPLLRAATGELYMLISAEKQTPLMAPKRLALANGGVRVQGLLVQGRGIQAIYVEDLRKAPEPEAAR